MSAMISVGRGLYDDGRMEGSMGAISGDSDASQLDDTIAKERDARTRC